MKQKQKPGNQNQQAVLSYVSHGSSTDENGFRHTGSQVVGHQPPLLPA